MLFMIFDLLLILALIFLFVMVAKMGLDYFSKKVFVDPPVEEKNENENKDS